jgi:uncharacterized protein (TIGR03086 family)
VDNTPTLIILDRLVAEVGALLDDLDAAAWAAPTPCPEFDVHRLAEHLVGGLRDMAAAAEGRSTHGFTEPSVARADAAQAYRAAGTSAVAAWSVPGRLEGDYAMPWGVARGAHLVGFLVLEQVAHGWDLCQALGRRAEFDGEAVAIADGVAHAMGSAMRSPGMFGPELPPPDAATPLENLVAFLGRQVRR